MLPLWVTPRLVRIVLVGAAVLAVVVGTGLVIRSIYSAGYDSGRLQGELNLQTAIAASEKSRGESLQRLIDANARIATMGEEAAKREQAALAQGRAQIKAMERAIRENPQFAAVERPPAFRGVRDEQLADIAAEADRSAELSAASLRGVRAPDSP